MKRLSLALLLALTVSSSAQTIRPDQVRGTAIVQTPPATQATSQLNGTLYADQFPGADAGAKINAADTALGSSAGTIIYSATAPATASTTVVLSSKHRLILKSPISWTASITLPDNSSGQDISCPALQTLAYTGADSSWIVATGVSNVAFHDCQFAGTLTTGPITRGALFWGAKGITVSNNTASEALLVAFGSSAAYTTCADTSQCQYPNVTASNSSSNITVSGNRGTATGTGSGVFIFLDYVNNATVSGNVASGYFDFVMFWGGDSCTSGCTAGQNGALANERKTTGLTISGNAVTNSLDSCIWGSMGRYVVIANNTCAGNDSTTDVGVDFEGGFDSTASNNTVSGYNNGDLAIFWLSTRVSFDHNKATQDVASHPIISTHNSTNIPDGLEQSFTNNDLNCTAATACTSSFEAAEIYKIAGNNFHNTKLSMIGSNISQIEIAGNNLDFDLAADYGIRAQTSSGTALSTNGSVIVRNNTILSSAAQATGAQAIFATGADANHLSDIHVDGNMTGGVNAFPVDIECDAASSNAGIPTYCTLFNNALGSNSVVTSNGSSGAPVKVQSINGMQTVTTSGCAITPGAIGNNCQVSVTLPVAEPDTNYTAICSADNAAGGVAVENTSARTPTGFSVGESAQTTTTTGGGTISCMIFHH